MNKIILYSVVLMHINMHAMLTAALMRAVSLKSVGQQARTIVECNRVDDHRKKQRKAFVSLTTTLAEGLGLKGVAALEHAKKFEQELRIAREDYCEMIPCNHLISDDSTHLAQAADLDQSACVQVMLNYANKQGRKFEAGALHMAQSEEVAEHLLESGMFDVNDRLGSTYGWTALHTVPNNVVPCLLRYKANAQQEFLSQSESNRVGYSLNKSEFEVLWDLWTGSCSEHCLRYDWPNERDDLFVSISNIPIIPIGIYEVSPLYSSICCYHSANSLIHDGDDEDYGRSFGTAKLIEICERVFTKQKLTANIKKFCVREEDYDRGVLSYSYYLNLSPVAAAIVMKDPQRLKLFFEHAPSEAIIPQIEKLQFLAKWLPAFVLNSKNDYRILGDMVDDYARGHGSRVIESV